ncbi:uncharacterized protein V1510DRAFT_414486 [Dipodascopsis tothii]|uniref:uncharacterized protein n=1 Tax=Dipodascopsis tothii TaxID=44089 RepID=UPI0034CEAB00
MRNQDRKVAVVTGSNSGIGFEIVRRLLESLPADTPITVVLVARHLSKVTATVDRLRSYEASHKYLVFDYVLMDLGSLTTVYDAAKQLRERYTKIDYLFCNAGGSDFTGIAWWPATKQVLADPVGAATLPVYKLERTGRVSEDGVGWVFQLNVYGHYFLAKQLLPQLRGGRVMWTSSIEADLGNFVADDVTLMHSNMLYERTKKYQDLLHYTLEPLWRKQGVRTFLTHPGICATSIFAAHLNWFSSLGMILMFCFVRILGSPWHVVDPYKGALAAVWAATEAESPAAGEYNLKHGTASSTWYGGPPRVLTTPLDESTEDGKTLLATLDELYAKDVRRIESKII